MRKLTILGLLFTLAFAIAAAAQPADRNDRLRARWDAILGDVQREIGTPQTDAEKRVVYREAIRRLIADSQLRDFFTADAADIDALVRQVTPEQELSYIRALADAAAGERSAKSANASATNPSAPRTTERSGFTDLVALALDARNVFGVDKSAVSINLNALALVGLNSDALSAPAAYRRFDALRRLGGTFTFGAKVPEGEITGFSGLPSAETLLDVFSWDAKVRVVGDRDPRATRWHHDMVAVQGGLVEIAGNMPAFVPITDAPIIAALLEETLTTSANAIRERIGRSLQVSVKVAGQHLTNATGKNKYTVAVLGDQGFGNSDLTFNLLYSVVDDVSLVPGSIFTVRTFRGAFGFNADVARNLLVQGRTTKLSVNVNIDVPVGAALPVTRENRWDVVGSVALPWGDAAQIPVSLTFTNDPNKLTKQNYVSGFIGVNYDFGALKSLFRPQLAAQ